MGDDLGFFPNFTGDDSPYLNDEYQRLRTDMQNYRDTFNDLYASPSINEGEPIELPEVTAYGDKNYAKFKNLFEEKRKPANAWSSIMRDPLTQASMTEARYMLDPFVPIEQAIMGERPGFYKDPYWYGETVLGLASVPVPALRGATAPAFRAANRVAKRATNRVANRVAAAPAYRETTDNILNIINNIGRDRALYFQKQVPNIKTVNDLADLKIGGDNKRPLFPLVYRTQQRIPEIAETLKKEFPKETAIIESKYGDLASVIRQRSNASLKFDQKSIGNSAVSLDVGDLYKKQTDMFLNYPQSQLQDKWRELSNSYIPKSEIETVESDFITDISRLNMLDAVIAHEYQHVIQHVIGTIIRDSEIIKLDKRVAKTARNLNIPYKPRPYNIEKDIYDISATQKRGLDTEMLSKIEPPGIFSTAKAHATGRYLFPSYEIQNKPKGSALEAMANMSVLKSKYGWNKNNKPPITEIERRIRDHRNLRNLISHDLNELIQMGIIKDKKEWYDYLFKYSEYATPIGLYPALTPNKNNDVQ